MKKFIATALTMLTVFSCSAVAFAADETVLTTTVPDATYTLNIPADQEIAFGATSTDIGTITVTDSSGFAVGKDLQVTITYDDFKADGISTTIPYYINSYGYYYYRQPSSGVNVKQELNVRKDSGSYFTFEGTSNNGTCHQYYVLRTASSSTDAENSSKTLQVKVNGEDWGKALGGDYSSTITFTAEVVSSQS